MKADELRPLALLEVAEHGVPDLSVELFGVVGFSEDGFTESPGRVPPFRRFLHDEDQLFHPPAPSLRTSLIVSRPAPWPAGCILHCRVQPARAPQIPEILSCQEIR